MKQRKPWLDYSIYILVRILISVVQAARLETCDRLSEWLATLFTRYVRVRAQVIDENLRHAFPALSAHQRQDLAWRMWKHLFMMVAEVAHARRKMHVSNWHRHVHIRQMPSLVRYLIDPRPKVIVSGHFGNFEVAGYMLGMFGFPTFTVARPLDNVYLDRFITRFRSTTGQYMLPKGDSAAQIALLLERGASLTVLADQNAGQKGCWVDFFGRLASTHKAIGVFALSSGAPMLVTTVQRANRPLQFVTEIAGISYPEELDPSRQTVPELTQWFTHSLETKIREAPEQYWWLHRRWKGKPGRRKSKRAREAA